MKKFQAVGTGLGLFLSLMIGGCQAPEGSGQLLAQPDAGRAGGAGLPLRLSRAFFENEMSARLDVKLSDGSAAEAYSSRAAFEMGAPEGPAPGPDALADFRDRPGCAVLSDTQPVALCFRVMPDVSSVSLSEGRMWPQGLKEFLSERSSCGTAISDPKLTRAVKTGSGIEVTYELAGLAEGPCAGKTLSADLILTQS
jgi:hypothetical protein